MMNKNILSFFLLFTIGLCCNAQGPVIMIEEIPHTGVIGDTDLTGFTTYRLYAQLDNAGQNISTVYGEETNPLAINTTTSFYQNTFGGITGSDIQSAFFPIFPELEWDSYVTIGSIGSENVGIPLTEDPSGLVPVSDLYGVTTVSDNQEPWEITFESGGNIGMSTFVGGAWFALPTEPNGFGVGIDNSVLIAQLTTDGDLSFCLNVQVFDGPNNETLFTNICEGITASGCGNDTACNYNANAEPNNELCVYSGDTCDDFDANTLNDVIDENCNCSGGLAGCTNSEAVNFDSNATEDDGSCIGLDCSDEPEVYNYCYENNENSFITFTESTPGSGVAIEFLTGSVESNFDILNVYEGEDNLPVQLEIDGDLSGLVFSTTTSVLTLEIETDGSVSCVSGSQTPFEIVYFCSTISVGGCTDNTACNFDSSATSDNGTCTYPGDECNDFDHNTTNDVLDADCNCGGSSLGCTDSLACNFDPTSSVDNGSCIFPGDACDDFNLNTGLDVVDSNCNCIGNASSCTDSEAINYNESAETDDGTCVYSSCDDLPNTYTYCYESNEETAWNFTEAYEGEGLTIYFLQGTIETGWDIVNIYEGEDNTPVALDLAGDLTGLIYQTSTSSLTVELIADVTVSCAAGNQLPLVIEYYCSDLSIPGCTNTDACNYNPDASVDSGTCQYPGDSCDDFDHNTTGDMLQADCTCLGIVGGCTDATACNFDSTASADDGTCIFPGDSCDDGNELTALDSLQDDCTCAGVGAGCTDPAAVNFDDLAVEDDGSCCFDNSIEIVLRDSFGDGGPSFILSDNSNNVLSTGTLNNGFGPLGFTSCVSEGCFIFELIPDVFPMEISADIVVNGVVIYTHEEGQEFDNYPLVFNVGNDPDCVIYGCTDSTACNFSGLATEDDESCDFEICVGCSSPGASNYSELVTTDDGSCEYDVSGFVFIDDNYNGILDPFEAPLSYQTVTLEPGGIQVITGDNGEFSFTGLTDGTYLVTVNYTAEWTNYTTAVTQTYMFPADGGQTVYFGVTNEEVPAPSACVDFYQWGFGVPCNDVLNYNICYRNMSPYAINGVVEVVLDPLLSYNSSVPNADNVDGQTITWDFENLGSWIMNFDDIIVNTPDETHIGEFMTSTVTIYGWYDGELIPLTQQSITQEITCAYDPNDITGIPEGYTEDHLTLPDTRMEYLIRFQNTGNAPATNVMVVDTLDVDMDPATFQLMANSHSVMTTVFPSGRVEFMFEDINLPDSTENEPESHGLISFKIDFNDGVAIGEEINQTAHIFFDNNPAVVTNTTWHTIHECGGEAVFTPSSTEVCAGESISFISEYENVEDYQWNINSAPAGNNENYEQVFTEAGDYIIQLVSENPICQESTMQMITVYNLPESEITESGAILTATEGASYQWFLNGEAIYGAVEQTYEATEDGSFSVEVTNENNCSTVSESVMIVSISELENSLITIYPNPMTNNATLEFSNTNKKTVRLIDAQGKEIELWENVSDQQIRVQRGNLSSGKYFITVVEGDSQKTVSLIIR